MPLSRSVYAEKLEAFSDVALANDAAFEHCGHWGKIFGDRIGADFAGRLILEVGCFDASFLIRLAGRHPNIAFVGLDWKCKPLYDAARSIFDGGLRNIILLRGRAQDVRKIFAVGEIDEAWLFHPDPCDKPAELKNRLFAEPFLLGLATALKNDRSLLAMKTDHPGYFQWVLGLLGLPGPEALADSTAGRRCRDLIQPAQIPPASRAILERFIPAGTSTNFWNDDALRSHVSDRLFAKEMTPFEQRFVKKREPIYYVELRKRPMPNTHSG